MPTSFCSLVGNHAIKNYLNRMIQNNAIGNSLLFAGPNGVGKSLFAYALAAQLICRPEIDVQQRHKIENGIHPDIHIYRPEGKLGLHSIQSLRELNLEVHLPPYESNSKVFIIHEAERMLSVSANALLKTFEEPPPKTVIILLSQSKSALLPTIISRCRTLHFQPIAQEEIKKAIIQKIGLEEETAQTIANLSQGSLGRAFQLAQTQAGTNHLYLLEALAKLPMVNYKELTQMIGQLTEQIEASKKIAEEAIKEELLKSSDSLSAAQQHQLEKEIEGISTQVFFQEVEILFNQLLSWYRDLHLFHLIPNSSFLIHTDYIQILEQAVQRGNLLPLQFVQKSIDEARLSLQRSTALNICLENLFLKLKWI
jgi:DNA polymerase-3 subunit delta'